MITSLLSNTAWSIPETSRLHHIDVATTSLIRAQVQLVRGCLWSVQLTLGGVFLPNDVRAHCRNNAERLLNNYAINLGLIFPTKLLKALNPKFQHAKLVSSDSLLIGINILRKLSTQATQYRVQSAKRHKLQTGSWEASHADPRFLSMSRVCKIASLALAPIQVIAGTFALICACGTAGKITKLNLFAIENLSRGLLQVQVAILLPCVYF